ncbi:MAG: hypothetical protein GY701_26030 [Sulfitobacter sp.]|nr:hypothetical protein [Sulfitobacter sp.]
MAELKHLLVVVPGIGGSVLESRESVQGIRAEPVWSGSRSALVRALAHPDDLHLDRPLVATGLLERFTVIPWFKSIEGYSGLWQRLRMRYPGAKTDTGDPDEPNLSATLVAFPYDFRLGVADASNRLAANIHNRLRVLGSETRVVIVAHSMGGLVARHWAAARDTEHRCDAIITLGTPHRGAPKAIDVMWNGLYWGSPILQRPSLSAVVQGWPGLHDLLPTEKRIVDSEGRLRRLDEIAVPEVIGRAITASKALHDEIETKWLELDVGIRPALAVVRSEGHGTPALARADNSGSLSVVNEWFAAGGLVEPGGDGAVPAWSAVPPELGGGPAAEVTWGDKKRHGVMPSSAILEPVLDHLLDGGRTPTAVRGEPLRSPVIGLDLADICGPEGEVQVGVRLHVPDGVDTVEVRSTQCTARMRTAVGETVAMDVEPAQDGFVVAPPQIEGDLSIVVNATLEDGRRVSSSETVGVIA